MDTEQTNVNAYNTITILDKLIRAGWQIAIWHETPTDICISAKRDFTTYRIINANGLLYAIFALYRQMQAVGAI